MINEPIITRHFQHVALLLNLSSLREGETRALTTIELRSLDRQPIKYIYANFRL